MTFQPRHLLVAATLHVLMFGLLAGGVQCTRKIPPPVVIEAVLYDPSRQEVAERKKGEEQRRENEKRRQAEEKKRQQAEAEKKARAELERKETEARQREEQEKKKAAEAEKKKAADEKERQKKEEQERLKKEQQQKREREAQEKRAAEMKAQMQREIEQENLRRQMDQEARALAQSEMNARINDWGAMVTRHIQRNWIRPAGNADDFECAMVVQLLPDGAVREVRITRSCGSPALNKSVEDAVYRSSPIPRPEDPAVFQRELNIIFKPR